MTLREDFQRARSEREKNARREEILDAAEMLLRGAASDRFAISALADQVGVSKSTVFLYFANKDELLLALYTRAADVFFNRFKHQLYPGMPDQEFCEAFIDSALATPTMLLLRNLLASTIERNVSQSSMIANKRDLLCFGAAAAYEVEVMLGLEPGKGGVVLKALMNLTAGAAQADVLPFVQVNALPDDVAGMIRLGETRTSFLSGAELVLRGIRT